MRVEATADRQRLAMRELIAGRGVEKDVRGVKRSSGGVANGGTVRAYDPEVRFISLPRRVRTGGGSRNSA